MVEGQIIGRHCIYVGEIPWNLYSSQSMEKVIGLILAKQEASIDPALENNGLSTMMYQFISKKAVCEESILRFENQIQRVFYREYPLEISVEITSGIVMPKGEHDLRIELVNAVTQKATLINKESIVSISSCKIINISGILLLRFEVPGIYYVNTYIDNLFIGTRILYAETYDHIKEYGLQVEEDAIQQGRLIILTKFYR